MKKLSKKPTLYNISINNSKVSFTDAQRQLLKKKMLKKGFNLEDFNKLRMSGQPQMKRKKKKKFTHTIKSELTSIVYLTAEPLFVSTFI
jgi:hypothetical protein